MFKRFVIDKLFGVVATAIQRKVDCEDYISHVLVLTFHAPVGPLPRVNLAAGASQSLAFYSNPRA